ncbi:MULTISPECIES: SRPBCC domain-containing protein [unclassified Micromonospora]|uniref:SRPBCC domain-containing protein n=1 Tax=Micromonospora sp. NPDC005206 TaxID=3157022 RepID=UPI0033BDA46F
MIEIGAQVDLSHPPDRVWLALTDRELLGRWFAEADVAEVPDRLVLHTAGLPGFDANVEVEVIERRVPELLTMRCDEAGRLTEVTCAVTATKQGCRLAVREVTTHGTWSAEQHDPREQQLRQALTVRLPAILDWLAFQQVDLRRGEAGMTAELPTIGALREGPARARRRRRTVVAVLTGAVLVAGLAAWVALPGEPDTAAAPPPATPSPTQASASEAAVVPTGSPRATPSARPSRTAASATARPSRTPTVKPSPTLASVPASPPLTASYRTDSSRLFGYTGEVVVENPGGAPVADWVVVVTLAESSTFDDVDGADVKRDGRTLTFSGPAVPAGGSKTFQFDVRDSRPKAREPEGCTVDGNPCAGT